MAYITPWTGPLPEGEHVITFPDTYIKDGVTYAFKEWEDGSTNPKRTVSLITDMSIICYYEEVSVVSYGPSEVSIDVYVTTPTEVLVDPSSVGTPTSPAPEGSTVDITATLKEKIPGTPISGKTLHFYGSAENQLDSKTTDANGQATFTYTVDVVDDGKKLKIKYLGD